MWIDILGILPRISASFRIIFNSVGVGGRTEQQQQQQQGRDQWIYSEKDIKNQFSASQRDERERARCWKQQSGWWSPGASGSISYTRNISTNSDASIAENSQIPCNNAFEKYLYFYNIQTLLFWLEKNDINMDVWRPFSHESVARVRIFNCLYKKLWVEWNIACDVWNALDELIWFCAINERDIRSKIGIDKHSRAVCCQHMHCENYLFFFSMRFIPSRNWISYHTLSIRQNSRGNYFVFFV